MVKTYSVTGMTCSACSSGIEKSVGKLAGVKHVEVSLMGKSMKIDYDESVTSEEAVFKCVQSLGYGIYREADRPTEDAGHSRERLLLTRFIISVIILVPLMYVSMGHMIADYFGTSFPLGYLDPAEYPQWFCLCQLILSLLVIAVNHEYFTRGVMAFVHRAPNMDSLVCVGSGVAFIYSLVMTVLVFVGVYLPRPEWTAYHMSIYFECAAMILALVDIGKWLEERSKAKTGGEIEKLLRLAPDRVTREDSVYGINDEVSVRDVRVGDTVIVKQGEYIPVDGVITEGSSYVDKSAVTGESLPQEVGVGDAVTSAALNKGGVIKIRAEKVGDDTTLSKIVKMVKDAGASKAPIQKFADRVAGVFVPIVIVLAIVTFLVWILIDGGFVADHCVTYAINVLVISCPCAMGLATPVAIMTSTGKAASLGILYKDAENMQALGSINCVLLDKTATITEGHPAVTDVVTYGCTEEDAMFIASGLEKNSNHPLARCITDYHESGAEIENFVYSAGRGAEGEYCGKTYRLGNEKLVGQADFRSRSDAARFERDGKSVLYLAEGKKIIAIIAVSDRVKEGSAEAVALLKKRGMRVAMVTGDSEAAALAVARSVGIDEYVADVLPGDKLKAVQNVQTVGGVVSMVGDGINDSPALKESDVGIAMGSGTDVAIDTAGVVLMSEDLRTLDTVFDLSRATMRNIKQNLFWAFIYNIVMIPVAAGVFSKWFSFNPMISALCMCISSLFVVCNALRLLRYRNRNLTPRDTSPDPESVEGFGGMHKVKVGGMMCARCVEHVTKALETVPGITSVSVSLEKNTAYVYGDIKAADVRRAINDAGYKYRGMSHAGNVKDKKSMRKD